MKTDEQLIWESYVINEKATSVSYGCLMVYIYDDLKQQILDFISKEFPEDILDPEEGSEDEPHVTVLYGFHEDVNVRDIRSYIKENFTGPSTFTLGKISKFDNPKYDVIKIEVVSEDLLALHTALKEHFKNQVTVTFPDYNAHVTLAYCKKGQADKLLNDETFKDITYNFEKFIYSEPEQAKKYSFTY